MQGRIEGELLDDFGRLAAADHLELLDEEAALAARNALHLRIRGALLHDRQCAVILIEQRIETAALRGDADLNQLGVELLLELADLFLEERIALPSRELTRRYPALLRDLSIRHPVFEDAMSR